MFEDADAEVPMPTDSSPASWVNSLQDLMKDAEVEDIKWGMGKRIIITNPAKFVKDHQKTLKSKTVTRFVSKLEDWGFTVLVWSDDSIVLFNSYFANGHLQKIKRQKRKTFPQQLTDQERCILEINKCIDRVESYQKKLLGMRSLAANSWGEPEGDDM